MLAFSNDYYGMIFRATQSVELFCAYETRIVMLDIWQKLYEFDPVLFSPKLTGPFCQRGCCEEGTMSCGIPIPKEWSPLEIMKADYPLLVEGREAVYEN